MTGQKRLKNAKVLVRRRGRARVARAAVPGRRRGRARSASSTSTWSTSRTCSARSSTGSPTSAGPRPQSARDSITEINPYVNVVLHEERLDTDNALQIFGQYDLIVDGTDNFATRYLVNDACVLLGKPYVWGSIYRFDGQASVFWAEHGPVLPLPVPRAAAARHGAVLRRGRRARRAVRLDRVHPGQRGDQAHHRHRRAAGRAADDLRRPGDELPHGQGQEGPRVRRSAARTRRSPS